MILYVANIGGRDEPIDYSDIGKLQPTDATHAPVNYHAFAAATKGHFFSHLSDLEKCKHEPSTLISLINRNPSRCLSSLSLLKERFEKVYVAWKECGILQVFRALDRKGVMGAYRDILKEVDGVVYPSLDPPPLATGKCFQLLTPYPVDLSQWDRSIVIERREGVFLGTREWFVPGRCHALGLSMALSLATKVDSFVTVINQDGKKGRNLYLECFGDDVSHGRLRLIEGRKPYLEYLDIMARHRLVFQWDRGGVPGQVAGDALLCRLICVGGNSAIEKEIFGHYLDQEEAVNYACRLLKDDDFYAEEIAASQKKAQDVVSFSAFRNQVPALFG